MIRRLFALLLLCLLPAQARAAGTVVYSGGTGTAQSPFNLTISNTAPSFIFTDTTASAKSLTIAVDANLAQFRESAGAAGSLLVLDLANNLLGVGKTPGAGYKVDVEGYIRTTGNNRFVQSYTGGATRILQVTDDPVTTEYFFMFLDGSGTTLSPILGANLNLAAADLTFKGANGQKWVLGRKTELTTIAAAATTTTTITIPANAILEAVLMRVTTVIPTAATMVVTATTSGTILQQGASISVAAGTTDIGTRANGTNYGGVAAQTITITPNATPIDNTGRVRFDIYYRVPTVATS